MSEREIEAAFRAVRDRSRPGRTSSSASSAGTALVVSCSTSDCDHAGAHWPTDDTWTVLGVGTLGNQAWERDGGTRRLHSSVDHPRVRHDVTAVLVVGHTRCEVLADAYEEWAVPGTDWPAGIEKRLSPLVSLVERGFERGVFAESTPLRTARHRLVEYNVRHQEAFLRETLPPSVTTAGYVHDQDGAYGVCSDGRCLVALDGETDPTEIGARVPEDISTSVATLLE